MILKVCLVFIEELDFPPEELDNPTQFLENYNLNPEIGMALLFQFSEEQPLPITVIESLKIFWNYAIKK